MVLAQIRLRLMVMPIRDPSFDPVMEEIDRWSLDGFDGHPAGVKQRPLCCAHATIVVLKDALELAQNSKSCRSSAHTDIRNF